MQVVTSAINTGYFSALLLKIGPFGAFIWLFLLRMCLRGLTYGWRQIQVGEQTS